MKTTDKVQFDKENVFGTGNPNAGFAQYFSGESFLNPLVDPKKTSLGMFNVTFEPGCRNNWHIHHAKAGGGQILICTAGEGCIRKKAKRLSALFLERLLQSRQVLSIGMVQRQIRGFPILPLRFPV